MLALSLHVPVAQTWSVTSMAARTRDRVARRRLPRCARVCLGADYTVM